MCFQYVLLFSQFISLNSQLLIQCYEKSSPFPSHSILITIPLTQFSLFIHFFFISFFIMSLEPKQNKQGISPIIEARSLLSKGDVRGAFAVLKKAADGGNVMACYDCGFMMIQGIGCEEDLKGGLELIERGRKLGEQGGNEVWKSAGSATDVLEPQSMDLRGLF